MQLQKESAPIVSFFVFLSLKTNPSFSANFCSTYQQTSIPKSITIFLLTQQKKTTANQVLQRLFD
jgi:hypothetical protein